MKPKTQHTKGPWNIHNNIGRKGELGIIADAAPCIIAIMGNQKAWPQEAEANARLIAAAPALLEACQAALHLVQELRRAFDEVPAGVDAWQAQVWTKTREAIRQAEGE